MFVMNNFKDWLPTRGRSLLPTTVKSKDKQTLSKNFFKGLTYLRHFFQAQQKQLHNPENDAYFEPSVSKVSFRKSSSSSSLIPASYPSYLNSGAVQRVHQEQRRQPSLLEGCEQTMHLINTSKKHTRLVLPSGVDVKHRNAESFKYETTHLPVPILPIPKFKVPSTLHGYLDSSNTLSGKNQQSTTTSVIIIILIFTLAVAAVVSVYKNFPEMDEKEYEKLKLPRNIEEAKELGRVLSKYTDSNYYEVITAFFITYIFLQTFAIPGSVFLSILSGFLYPFYLALFLVCLCSGIGATGCYILSYYIGKPLINKYLWNRVQRWNAMVDSQRDYLLNYLLFLRITPFLPNWFINIVSPIIHIPLPLFFVATFLGVAPLSFIAVQGGTTLYQLTRAGDAFSWTGFGVMSVFAMLSMLPVVFKNLLKKKFE